MIAAAVADTAIVIISGDGVVRRNNNNKIIVIKMYSKLCILASNWRPPIKAFTTIF